MPIDLKTLEFLNSLRTARASAGDWKAAFDRLLVSARDEFIYDHVVLYLVEPSGKSLDVAHARAIGRGQAAEADVSWGEEVANKVVSSQRILIQEPEADVNKDRLSAPFLIGLPVRVAGRLGGVLVFVRFGGPAYSGADRLLAEFIAAVEASVLESLALERARGELESAQHRMRLQDDFLSTISHQLLTPLGFIKGYGTSLLRQDTQWDEATRREFLSIIDQETDRLTRLIEDLLESARLQSDTFRYKIRPVQLDVLLREVTSRVCSRHPDLKVELDFDSISSILGDGEQLAVVFENLFSNALKYAPGAALMIRMRRVRKSLRVSFSDQGPGIPQEFLPFIFERFYRVPASVAASATSTGIGLGLYICQQIILAHHGKVWAESTVGKGTTFLMDFPVESAG